jgi:hypothetical protein
MAAENQLWGQKRIHVNPSTPKTSSGLTFVAVRLLASTTLGGRFRHSVFQIVLFFPTVVPNRFQDSYSFAWQCSFRDAHPRQHRPPSADRVRANRLLSMHTGCLAIDDDLAHFASKRKRSPKAPFPTLL